jgi:hypothetical protein
MQQVQPAFRQAAMQSQQPWIIDIEPASPLMQVTTQPSFVISHLQVPMKKLQVQQTMPFIMQVHDIMPPASMLQRFCIMAQATGSSHLQVIFMPSLVFSHIILQRGTIIMLGAIGVVPMPGIGEVPMPGIAIPIPARSIIIVLVIILTS